MTLIATERPAERRITESGGKRTGLRVFRVRDDAGAVVTETEAAAHPDIPVRGTVYPSDNTLRATDKSVEQVKGAVYVFDVTILHEQIPPLPSAEQEQEPEPGEIGYTEISTSVRTEFVDAWRRFASPSLGLVPDLHPYGLQAETDIGGVPIDSRGEPVSVLNIIQVATIEVTVGFPPNNALIRSIAGRRNFKPYLGAAAGFLLYVGAESTRIGQNRWTVAHEFWYDSYAHLRQIVARWEDGSPKVGDVTDPWGIKTYSEKGTPVYWVQPYVQTKDFNLLGLRIT